MLSEFLYYLVGILAVVGGVLLLERIVAGPHTTSGTGYARVDSAFDFDRLRGKQFITRATNLLGRHGRSTLPLLQDIPHDHWHPRDVGEQLIPVASIVGSVDGASQRFDRNFRPVSDRARARLGSVLVAMREGEPLRPSKSGLGTASTTYSTVTTGLQQRALWVATTSALMSLKWAETRVGRRTDVRRLMAPGQPARILAPLRA